MEQDSLTLCRLVKGEGREEGVVLSAGEKGSGNRVFPKWRCYSKKKGSASAQSDVDRDEKSFFSSTTDEPGGRGERGEKKKRRVAAHASAGDPRRGQGKKGKKRVEFAEVVTGSVHTQRGGGESYRGRGDRV